MGTIMKRILTAMLVLACGPWAVQAADAPEQLHLQAELLHGALLSGRQQTTYLMIKMIPPVVEEDQRAPINVSIVLDRSGSMTGEKLHKAKLAAKMAIEQLRDDDLLSVVAYDDVVTVPYPAAKISNRASVQASIQSIRSGGTTALFAGVSKGAVELRKHHDRRQVNRIVLLSDGIANVGPSSPEQLAELGESLAKEGIAVTTIGLGLNYNEDLLTRLAVASQGNHSFVAEPEQLHEAFVREFGKGLNVVAQGLHLVIECAPWVKPVRVLNAKADILEDRVELEIGQLYSGRKSYLLLEIEVLPPESQTENYMGSLAQVQLKYGEMQSGMQRELLLRVKHESASDEAQVQASTNTEVRIAVAQQLGMDQSLQAVRLRDKGTEDEAIKLMLQNAAFLAREAKATGSSMLEEMSRNATREAEDFKNRKVWPLQRKRLQTIQVIRGPGSGY
ncbi:MAG: VWA domain-containing protein [Deltaproteobacteria bacterium]|nr:VWA domain-containing protein [Deltaproteobacteria bacterium]